MMLDETIPPSSSHFRIRNSTSIVSDWKMSTLQWNCSISHSRPRLLTCLPLKNKIFICRRQKMSQLINIFLMSGGFVRTEERRSI